MQQIRNQMPVHPVTNNSLLEGSNYRTWALAMERLLDSQDLLHVIETEDSDRRQRAQVRNTLSEHCVPEIRDVFFSESLAPPYDVWINLLSKFGPTNTMLGDSAKSTLLRQRWKVGDDPGTFLNRIEALVAELKYYGKSITDDKLIEIFPTFIPSEGDWSDFEKTLMNSVTLDWIGLKSIFMKRANYANIRPVQTNSNMVFQVASTTTKTDHTPWHQNGAVIQIFDQLASAHGILICLKCRRFGHQTKDHQVHAASHKLKKQKDGAPKEQKPAPSGSGQANAVSLAQHELNSLLLTPNHH